MFRVCINETGQLCVTLNTIRQAYTVFDCTGNSQIVGICLVNITSPNTVISIINSSTHIAHISGDTNTVCANLVITRLV